MSLGAFFFSIAYKQFDVGMGFFWGIDFNNIRDYVGMRTYLSSVMIKISMTPVCIHLFALIIMSCNSRNVNMNVENIIKGITNHLIKR